MGHYNMSRYGIELTPRRFKERSSDQCSLKLPKNIIGDPYLGVVSASIDVDVDSVKMEDEWGSKYTVQPDVEAGDDLHLDGSYGL